MEGPARLYQGAAVRTSFPCLGPPEACWGLAGLRFPQCSLQSSLVHSNRWALRHEDLEANDVRVNEWAQPGFSRGLRGATSHLAR